MRKRYEHITAMVSDPATYAAANGMVGNHAPEVRRLVGAWRWPLVQKHREPIMDMLAKSCIDFGGSGGPIGYGATIVDPESPETPTLFDVEGLVHGMFTSHTLEHLRDVGLAVLSLIHKTKVGGVLVAQVPSWHNEKLQAANWPNHFHTFCLSVDADAPPEFLRLDALWFPWCELITATDDGVNILCAVRRTR